MSYWQFDSFSPTKEAFENRLFKGAKSVKHILELFVSSNRQFRGQLVLKGTNKDYIKLKEYIQFEAHDCLYIDYNNVLELTRILTAIEYNEAQIDRVIAYNIGYFHK